MSRLPLVTRVALLLTLSAVPLLGQQADVAFGASVSFLAPTGNSPQPGLTLVMSGSPGFALRLNGRMATRNSYIGTLSAASILPPWGADVDALFSLGGRAFGGTQRGPATFAILGFGVAASDTASTRVTARNWSYGLGTVLPIGSAVDLFVDSRWRVAQFVLPTANPKPDRTKELRFGLTYHVGSGVRAVR